MRFKLKAILTASAGALALIAAGMALANPTCPSTSFVKNIKLDAIAPSLVPGFYIVSSKEELPTLVTFYVNAKNIPDAFNRANKIMKAKITGSWTSAGVYDSKDFNTGKNRYYCEYRPYANTHIGPSTQEYVAIQFEDGDTPNL